LQISDGFELIKFPVNVALRKLDAGGIHCDICFLDPPYRLRQAYEDSLQILSQSQLLLPHSLVIVEHSRHFDPGEQNGRLLRYRKLKQGDAVLSFYKLA